MINFLRSLDKGKSHGVLMRYIIFDSVIESLSADQAFDNIVLSFHGHNSNLLLKWCFGKNCKNLSRKLVPIPEFLLF